MPSKSVIFLQPIFAPTESLKAKNIDSIKSLIEYRKKHGETFDVAFEGWAQEDSYWAEIEKEISQLSPIHVKRRDSNDGKAVTINSMAAAILPDSKYAYILTADSDMIFDTSAEDMIERLIKIANYMSEYTINGTKKKTGMIGLNQLVNTRHYAMSYKNSTQIMRFNESKETVVWPDNPFGIAGGALFICRKAWEDIGGYRKLGVYAGEDAYIIQDMHAKGYGYYISRDISMIHPYDNDEDYVKWKNYTLGHFNKGNIISDDDFKNVQGVIDQYFKNKNEKEKITHVSTDLD